MNFPLKLSHSTNAEISDTEKGLQVYFGPEGGKLAYPVPDRALVGMEYLEFDVFVLEEHSLCLTLDFYEKDLAPGEEARLWVKIGVLPQLATKISFPLSNLKSQKMFLVPSPGSLKAVVFGKPVLPEDVSCIEIGTVRNFHKTGIIISNVRLTNEPPDFKLPEGDIRVDAMGQYIPKAWPYKFKNIDAMVAHLKSLYNEALSAPDCFAHPDWNRWGGYKKDKTYGTGFFRTEKLNGRWRLVDPDGCLFFSTGMDCTSTGDIARISGLEPFFQELPPKDDPVFGCCWELTRRFYGDEIEGMWQYDFVKSNLIRAFGDSWWDAMASIYKYLMHKWNINTIGNWSDKKFIKESRLPYVYPLENFPTTSETIFRDFPDVMSPEYREKSKIFARQLKEFENDPCMVGYFLRNEPVWAFVEELCIAEEMLANPVRFVCKEVFVKRMEAKYGNISEFNRAWNLDLKDFDGLYEPIRRARSLSPQAAADLDAFSLEMYGLYNTVPSQACKEVDPHHLNLGMRYCYISQPGLVAGWQCFDVFSINCYSISPVERARQAMELMDLPVLVGEFQFGSLESGLTATGLKAVASQEERGVAYRYFMEQGAAMPNFVGAHHFTLLDQPALGRSDGENYPIGLMDTTLQSYKHFEAALTSCHEVIYEVAAGRRKPYDRAPKEIPRISF